MKMEFFKGLKYSYLRVDSSRLGEYVDYIKTNNIKAVEINNVSGYWLKDITFLQSCPEIEALSITNNDVDIEAIKYLKNLKILSSNSLPKVKIDLSDFTKLQSLSIDSHKNWLNISNCVSLKELRLWKYKGDNLLEFKNLENIEELAITQSTITSLKGLEYFPKIQKLEGRFLSKLTEIGIKDKIPSISYIEFESCKKVEDFDCLSYAENLEILYLLYCTSKIPSVKFIKNLDKLKNFSIKGTTIEDGNTSYFSKLDDFYFDNKKFYSHSYKELILPKLKQKQV